MAGKTIGDVTTIVMAYGPDPRNRWLTDPHGDDSVVISPVLATMPSNDFNAFFDDFTQYIRVDNGMPDVIPIAQDLKLCRRWSSLISYVFNLQI